MAAPRAFYYYKIIYCLQSVFLSTNNNFIKSYVKISRRVMFWLREYLVAPDLKYT